MNVFSNHSTRRFATALLCMVLLTVMLFSCLVVLIEHKHDCAGKECPVCALIDQAEANLTCLGMAEHISGECPLLPGSRFITRSARRLPGGISVTLVQLKVRQNK